MGRDPRSRSPAHPVGRRIVLGLLGLGAAGVVGGASFSRRLSEWLAPVELRDPTGLLGTLPLGPVFRFYSVTGGVEPRDEKTYRLQVDGWSRSRPPTASPTCGRCRRRRSPATSTA